MDVLANDGDADGDALTITSVGTPGNGTATVTGDDLIRYTPAPGFTGTDAFGYTVSDGNGGGDAGPETLTDVTELYIDPAVAQAGQKSQDLFEKKVEVGEWFAMEGPGTVSGAEVVLNDVSAGDDVSGDMAIEAIVADALSEGVDPAESESATNSNAVHDEVVELAVLGLAGPEEPGQADGAL